MMTVKGSQRRTPVSHNRGSFLIETVIASLILGVFLQTSFSFLARQTVILLKDRQLSSLTSEHETVRSTISGIKALAVRNILCGGHPYDRFDPTTNTCVRDQPNNRVPGFVNPPSINQVNSVRELAAASLDWPSIDTLSSNGAPNASLSENYFNSTLRDLVIQAQCTLCHDGTSRTFLTTTNGRNFRNYLDVTQNLGQVSAAASGQFPPLATKNILASPWGRTLLLQAMTFSNLLSNSKGIKHNVTIEASNLASNVVVQMHNTHSQTANTTSPSCPFSCPPGEAGVPGSCTTVRNSCTTSGGGGKKGSPPVTTCNYTHTYTCGQVDTSTGSAFSGAGATCPGTAPGACPVNQLLSACVRGSAAAQTPIYDAKGNITGYNVTSWNWTWSCFNPLYQTSEQTATRRVLNYQIQSEWTDADTGRRRTILSGGVFQ